jgi:hypothetical protein
VDLPGALHALRDLEEVGDLVTTAA